MKPVFSTPEKVWGSLEKFRTHILVLCISFIGMKPVFGTPEKAWGSLEKFRKSQGI